MSKKFVDLLYIAHATSDSKFFSYFSNFKYKYVNQLYMDRVINSICDNQKKMVFELESYLNSGKSPVLSFDNIDNLYYYYDGEIEFSEIPTMPTLIVFDKRLKIKLATFSNAIPQSAWRFGIKYFFNDANYKMIKAEIHEPKLSYKEASDILEKEYSNVCPNLDPAAREILAILLMYGKKLDFSKFSDKESIKWEDDHFVIKGQTFEIGRDIKMTSYDSCNNGFFAKIVNWFKNLFNKNEDHDKYKEYEEFKKMEDSINISNDKNPGTSGDIESVHNDSVSVESTECSDNISTSDDISTSGDIESVDLSGECV